MLLSELSKMVRGRTGSYGGGHHRGSHLNSGYGYRPSLRPTYHGGHAHHGTRGRAIFIGQMPGCSCCV